MTVDGGGGGGRLARSHEPRPESLSLVALTVLRSFEELVELEQLLARLERVELTEPLLVFRFGGNGGGRSSITVVVVVVVELGMLDDSINWPADSRWRWALRWVGEDSSKMICVGCGFDARRLPSNICKVKSCRFTVDVFGDVFGCCCSELLSWAFASRALGNMETSESFRCDRRWKASSD